MITTLSPQSGLDTVDSYSGITYELIQSLPPEQKDAALFRFCKTIEAKPTLVESFSLSQVLYRTISGNTFTESADSVAERTGCDRKTVLKGLSIAVEQNILEKNERPGTSTEYSFKPVEEWLPEPIRVRQSPAEGNPPAALDSPVVRIKDIRTKKILEFPSSHHTESVEDEQQLASNDEVVHSKDCPETDSNMLFVVNNLKEEQEEEVSDPATDTPTIWRRNPDATRYCQIPPIHDQEIGVEIQRQMEQEGLTAQKVVGRAVRLSKAPLMLLELLVNISTELFKSQPEPTPKTKDEGEALVSLELSKTLEMIGVKLLPRQLHKCVTEYGEEVMLNAAQELKRTGVLANKENPTGYFLGCLKNGMGQKPAAATGALQDEDEQQSKPTCSTSEIGQAMKPVASFSHVETNPRVTVACLIIEGQYERAAILAGLYGVNYEELVRECGVDDPRATILARKVTN